MIGMMKIIWRDDHKIIPRSGSVPEVTCDKFQLKVTVDFGKKCGFLRFSRLLQVV